MTKKEWMSIGYEKGIIDCEDYEDITFQESYKLWLKMKMSFTNPAL